MDFTEKQLRAFLQVVEKGSIGRAAAVLNMSQPALSRLIKLLEDQHQIALFDRHPSGVAVTPAGEALLPHARLLLFEMQQAADTLRAIRGLKRGVARVGAVAAIGRTILPGAVNRLLRHSPGLRVESLDSLDDRLLAALTGNQIDIMICGRVKDDPDIYEMGECQYDDTYGVLCAGDHPLASRDQVTLDDVLATSWVMSPRGATPRVLFEEILQKLHRSMPNIDIETSSPNTVTAYVIETGRLGWLPVPLFASERAATSVKQLDVKELSLPRRFFVYRRARGLLPAPAKLLYAMLPIVGRSLTLEQIRL